DRRRGPEVLERAFGITSAEACASDDVLNRRTEICKLPAMLGGGFVRLTLEWEVTVHRLDTHLSQPCIQFGIGCYGLGECVRDHPGIFGGDLEVSIGPAHR